MENMLVQKESMYGKFNTQIKTVSQIIDAMMGCAAINGVDPTTELLAEWHYLAIKIARIAASPSHTESYHGLAEYATLMEKERA
jgi:hypothetical protein